MILGKDLTISLNGVIIAASKSCTFDMRQTLLSTSSPFAGVWKEYVQERKEWTLNADTLCSTMRQPADLTGILLHGTAVEVCFRDPADDFRFEGTAYVESVSIGSRVKSLATFSLSLRGTGAISLRQKVEVTHVADDTPTGFFRSRVFYIHPGALPYLLYNASQSFDYTVYYADGSVYTTGECLRNTEQLGSTAALQLDLSQGSYYIEASYPPDAYFEEGVCAWLVYEDGTQTTLTLLQ